MKRRIEVVGAVIVSDGQILCTRRGPGALEGYWEFPGGKREPGESPQEALAREIAEELGCSVTVGEQVTTTEHEYDFAVVILTTYYCTILSGVPVLSEHTESVWLAPADLSDLAWAPADIPAVRQIEITFA